MLLTGAAGFIGRWVARALVAQKADLSLVVRNAKAAEPIFRDWGITGNVIESDLSGSDCTDVVRRARPEVTFNLAGYGVDPAERADRAAEAVNTAMPAALARAMEEIPSRWAGCRFVHAGSALEYGTATGDLREDTTPQPTTLYGLTKLAGTNRLLEITRTRGLRAVIGRLFTVYGPGEADGRLLPSLLRAARESGPVPLTNGQQRRDFTYVADTADGLLRLGAQPQAGIVNVASGVLRPVRVFVETAADVLGIPADRLRFGEVPTRREEMVHDPVSIARLRGLTGWAPSSDIAAGIRATMEFQREHSTS